VSSFFRDHPLLVGGVLAGWFGWLEGGLFVLLFCWYFEVCSLVVSAHCMGPVVGLVGMSSVWVRCTQSLLVSGYLWCKDSLCIELGNKSCDARIALIC